MPVAALHVDTVIACASKGKKNKLGKVGAKKKSGGEKERKKKVRSKEFISIWIGPRQRQQTEAVTDAFPLGFIWLFYICISYFIIYYISNINLYLNHLTVLIYRRRLMMRRRKKRVHTLASSEESVSDWCHTQSDFATSQFLLWIIDGYSDQDFRHPCHVWAANTFFMHFPIQTENFEIDR